MGCGRTGDSLLGLLPLEPNHPDSDNIFRTCDIEDEYKVEKEPIARGKFASVRLARHRVTGEVFAAKFIRRRRRAANLEGEARHEIAVLLLGRCSPHIVHLHQVFETRSEYVIILEFGEGGDLQRLLDDQGRLSEKTVRDLLRQVLKGLGFLHQRFVAHLDIKPQNLVLMGSCPEDGIKLVDFGLSRVIHRDAELTQIMGTPDYVAPEVINFEPVGLATDMWSIGVLTYVLLTGYTPFGGDTDQETFVNITQGDFDFPEEHFGDISDQAKDFISGLLIKSPNQRMTVTQCGSHPWLSDVLDPHRLSQLSEADSADSGYSTDLCNGSPPSPGTLTNGFVPDLCQFSIPEDRQLSTHESPLHSYSKQIRPHHQFHRLGEEGVDRDGAPERRPRVSGARLSMNVLECLQTQQRPQSRPLRRSSLVIPRSANDLDSHHQIFRETFTQGDAGFYDYDENQNNRIPLCPRSNLSSWNHSQIDSASAGISGRTHFDQDSHSNTSKPWNSLCYGSYSRALNQLKSPKKVKPKTNLGLRPELSCSMFELKPSYENNNMPFPDLRTSKHELRKSKADLRASKKDLRNQSKDIFSPRSDTRYSRGDLRGSTLSLDVQTIDHMDSISDIRESTSDLKSLKHDSRASPRFDLRKLKVDIRNQRPDCLSNGTPASLVRSNLFSSHNFASIPHLNMSLSRLDIAHETLDRDDSEERDIVYGDCTLPRRFNRNSISPLLRGNSIHMSFRRPKKRDGKI